MNANPEAGKNLARLVKLGFTRAGWWKQSDAGSKTGIVFDLEKELATARNVLYAFVVDDEVMYLGKTILSLHDRMQRYKAPPTTSAKGASTNIKNNRRIRESLERGDTVGIFVFCDGGALIHGGFQVSLAAGLEDALIREMDPEWNGGKEESPQ